MSRAEFDFELGSCSHNLPNSICSHKGCVPHHVCTAGTNWSDKCSKGRRTASEEANIRRQLSRGVARGYGHHQPFPRCVARQPHLVKHLPACRQVGLSQLHGLNARFDHVLIRLLDLDLGLVDRLTCHARPAPLTCHARQDAHDSPMCCLLDDHVLLRARLSLCAAALRHHPTVRASRLGRHLALGRRNLAVRQEWAWPMLRAAESWHHQLCPHRTCVCASPFWPAARLAPCLILQP